MAANSIFGAQPFEELVSPFPRSRHAPRRASSVGEHELTHWPCGCRRRKRSQRRPHRSKTSIGSKREKISSEESRRFDAADGEGAEGAEGASQKRWPPSSHRHRHSCPQYTRASRSSSNCSSSSNSGSNSGRTSRSNQLHHTYNGSSTGNPATGGHTNRLSGHAMKYTIPLLILTLG